MNKGYEGTTLNMTYLALRLSRYINGVAQKHGEVSRLMFAVAGYAGESKPFPGCFVVI